MAVRWVRVRIPGVGEWSQPAGKPLRLEVGEQIVDGSEHDEPYRDHPEPADEARPLPQDVVVVAPPPDADPAPAGARDSKPTKGA